MAIVGIIIIAIILNRLNASYFKWVKSYWFFDRTWISRFSSFFYMLSLFLLLLSLLDLRGPEKKIRASLPDQRTIIMIDTSTSMLAEDVRPSRFVKSLQMARHFVKSAAGHQISIVLFSDIQKRLIPFTDDIDLLDSRLAALEKTNAVSGGSNISQAIEEALQYFEFDSSDDDKSKAGNMLVFTDAEESEGEFKTHVPPNVNLAMVGVGTLKGSNIPLRWDDGSFRGYKTFNGEPVVTKLDENFLKKMAKNAKSYKYWIANSYSLPTDEIMNFFRAAYNKKQSTGDMRVRPVYSHYILIPAIILYCFSVLLGRFAMFKMAKNLVLIFALGLAVNTSRAQDEQPKEKPLSPEVKNDLEVIKAGKADRKYVLKVAEKMLKEKDEKRATELYSEYAKTNDEDEIRFNYATSLLKSNRQAEALPIIQDLMKNSKNEDLKNKLRNNVLLSMDPNRQKQKDQNKKDQKQDQNKQNNQDQKENDKKNEDKKNQDQNKQDNKKDGGKNNKDDQKKDNKPDGKQDNNNQKKPDKNGKQDNKDEKKDEKKDGNKDKDKDKKDQDQEKEDQKPQGPSTLEEKEKEIEQKRRMVKTPAMIKQIMSDDRDLQKKMMDTSTSERGEQKPKRDW
jgi:Ca-activated chloride channel family protein